MRIIDHVLNELTFVKNQAFNFQDGGGLPANNKNTIINTHSSNSIIIIINFFTINSIEKVQLSGYAVDRAYFPPTLTNDQGCLPRTNSSHHCYSHLHQNYRPYTTITQAVTTRANKARRCRRCRRVPKSGYNDGPMRSKNSVLSLKLQLNPTADSSLIIMQRSSL